MALLALLTVLDGRLAAGDSTRPTSVNQDPNPSLTLNLPVRGELSPGDNNTYRFELKTGQYLCARVDQVRLDVRVTIYAPAGKRLVDSVCRQRRTTSVSMIAETPGAYRIEVRSLERDASTGYEIKLEEVRSANPRDRNRITAQAIVAEADRLRANGNLEFSRRAVARYEAALTILRTIGDKREEARVLEAIARICQPIGESRKALDCHNRVLLLAQELRDLDLEGETRADIGYLYIQLGEYERAREFCAAALKVSRQAGNVSGEARAINNIGKLNYVLGDRQGALEQYERALLLWRDVNDRRGQAQSLLNLGYVFSDLREMGKASTLFQQALALWRALGDRRGEAMTMTAIGNLYSRSGKKQDALVAYSQARELAHLVGDPIEEGRVLTGFATVYQELRDANKALDFYKQALPLFRAASYRRGEAMLIASIGAVHQSMGSYEKAIAFLQEALSIMENLHDQILESYTLNSIASVYASQRDEKKALDHYNRALPLFQAAREPRGEAYALSGIGNIHDRLGDKVKALEYQNQALRLNRMAEDRFGEVSSLYEVTRLERDLGKLAEARNHIQDATRVIESVRTDVDSTELRTSLLAALRRDYELYVDVFMRSHIARPSDGFSAEALHTSERARARSLIELLHEARADIRRGVDPTLLERERILQKLLADKANLLVGRHTERQAVPLTEEIESIRTEYQHVQAQIRFTSPRFAALTQPQPLSLKEIQQQVLDPETLLLEYALGDERSYLWAVTPDSIDSFELPKRAEVEAAARRVYELLTAHNQIVKGETELQRERRVSRADAGYPKVAEVLSQMLLAPVASQLGIKRLLIVADGALQYIPFSALPEPSAQGMISAEQALSQQSKDQRPSHNSRPLILQHEIISLPSASALAVLRHELLGRKPAPKAVAVLADPVFSGDDPRVKGLTTPRASLASSQFLPRDVERAIKESGVSRRGAQIPRLPFSRREAHAIKLAASAEQAMAAVDFDASRATATSAELSQYRIVHFATHGLLDSEHPELSGIVLSLVDRHGQPQNGFLRLHEVYNLNLPAELVVLSACQTALGKEVKGEGLVGLTRGFMYAGAARVMASLWKVDDAATAELMKLFYGKMLGNGLRPAAALRDAQVEMSRHKLWHAPYYWAGFVLQGEWK